MTDQYTQRQLNNYDNATSESQRNDALYRLGTHLEMIPPDGDTNLPPESKQAILKEARKDSHENED